VTGPEDFADEPSDEHPMMRAHKRSHKDLGFKGAEFGSKATEFRHPQQQWSGPSQGRLYVSYAQVHTIVDALKDPVAAWRPDIMVAVGGGGFIPARMLRSELRIPLLAVSLEPTDGAAKEANMQVLKQQWFDQDSGSGWMVQGLRVLIVDLVDSSRTALQFCVRELMRTNGPSSIAAAVVHSKRREKLGKLPKGVAFFCGAEVEDVHICYPWDAASYGHNIVEHEALAAVAARGRPGAEGFS